MKENTKWYCYRNRKTNAEIRLPKKSYSLWLRGYRLIAVYDYHVDEVKMKVGGK